MKFSEVSLKDFYMTDVYESKAMFFAIQVNSDDMIVLYLDTERQDNRYKKQPYISRVTSLDFERSTSCKAKDFSQASLRAAFQNIFTKDCIEKIKKYLCVEIINSS